MKLSIIDKDILLALNEFGYSNQRKLMDQSGYSIGSVNKSIGILTEEKIKEYEEDLKKGSNISKKNYIITKNNYDNSSSRFILRVSKKIEKGFDKTIKFIFKKLSQTINE